MVIVLSSTGIAVAGSGYSVNAMTYWRRPESMSAGLRAKLLGREPLEDREKGIWVREPEVPAPQGLEDVRRLFSLVHQSPLLLSKRAGSDACDIHRFCTDKESSRKTAGLHPAPARLV
jgi:hypothetical protein